MDKEALRVELDTHSLDLRRKYLAIAEDYKTQVNEIIEWFVEDRDEIANGLTKARYRRILLLSIPNEIIDNRMKLYDEKMKFVADTEKLKAVLGENLPTKNLDAKITSNSFSTFYIRKEPSTIYTIVASPERIFESNLYNNGIIEIMFDAYITLDEGLILWMLKGLYRTIEQLYAGLIDKNEYVTLAVFFINARSMEFKKSDDVTYYGEHYYLRHQAEEKLGVILEGDFQNNFAEILINKINNLFNRNSII
jgi:hypothetical protein